MGRFLAVVFGVGTMICVLFAVSAGVRGDALGVAAFLVMAAVPWLWYGDMVKSAGRTGGTE